MTGEGPFGGVEMGGMFSVLKVRKDQKHGDYSNPSWYKHPEGTVALEVNGAVVDSLRSNADVKAQSKSSMPLLQKKQADVEVQIRKPTMEGMKH
jgi:manganese oxidase